MLNLYQKYLLSRCLISNWNFYFLRFNELVAHWLLLSTTKMFLGLAKQDSQEFIACLLDAIHENTCLQKSQLQ